MPRAVIVGATGQIGLATARRLVGEAWDVTVVSRHAIALPDGCRHVETDARDAKRLSTVVGSDTDLLLSCVAFDAVDPSPHGVLGCGDRRSDLCAVRRTSSQVACRQRPERKLARAPATTRSIPQRSF